MPSASTSRGEPRKRLLDAASLLFYTEGIRSVGVDRAAAEANVTKATLYRLFRSKENLVVAYLTERHKEAMSVLRESARRHESARDQVLAAFDSLKKKARQPQFRGCAFVMAVNEFPDSAAIGSIAREHKQAVRAHFAALLRPAGAPPQLSRYLAMLYDGALTGVSIARSAGPVDTARECARELLDHLHIHP